MKIVSSIAELANPKDVITGLVPTMGAFHEGHLELMREARKQCGHVVVSLFVNPTQFGQGEDFNRYPRDLDRDIALAEKVGVDVLFTPDISEVYPRRGAIVHVPVVTELWEGAIRPTHFDGVATVVCKLVNIVRCDQVFFGQKDLQQCIVVRRMFEDLNMPVTFKMCPTVREQDGLAMSSRNVYLSEEERRVAPTIFAQLKACRKAVLAGDRSPDSLDAQLSQSSNFMRDAGLGVDYFDLIDMENAHPVRNIEQPSAIVTAVRLGKTRLIDNILM